MSTPTDSRADITNAPAAPAPEIPRATAPPRGVDVSRDKIRQLFLFLREANQLQFRPVRVLAEQPKSVRLSDLPAHPAIELFRPIRVEGGNDVQETLLSVKRPQLAKCPVPPASFAGWLRPNWNDPSRPAAVEPSRVRSDKDGRTTSERFDEDATRFTDFHAWMEQRRAWVGPELAARKAMSYFEVFYEIHSALEKDGEQLELVIADGHVIWKATSSVDGPVTVTHPVLFKRVELRFDPRVPEFTVRELDKQSELYTSLFFDLEGVSSRAVRDRKTDLEAGNFHPLGWDETQAFLRSFIQTVSPLQGEYLEAPPPDGATSIPRLYRETVILLRRRVTGITNAVDAIIDDVSKRDTFPSSLKQITGTAGPWQQGAGAAITVADDLAIADPETSTDANDDEILLAKETNHEQLQIIRRLERRGAVNVQGPPGTGKTHTIGNLIGHLLAQGKSVLVTAQTAKALRVVRDQVPEALQPLTVSVLGSDHDARRQLESSVSAITERLTGETSESLLRRAVRLQEERRGLQAEVKQLARQLRVALENEYREVVAGERRFSPSDAARFVSKNAEHSWIPGPVTLGGDLPLSVASLNRLYHLSGLYSLDEEQDARRPLPDLAEFLSAPQFEALVRRHESLTTRDLAHGIDRWQRTEGTSESLQRLANDIAAEFSDDLRSQSWRPHAIVAGLHGRTEREVWDRMIAALEAAVEANAKHALVLEHRPKLSDKLPVPRQRDLCREICAHLDAGGKLGFFQLATRSEWRLFMQSSSVAAGAPSHRDHFDALGRLADLQMLRSGLELPWDRLVGESIGRPFNSLGTEPELSCRALIPEMRRSLDWHELVWRPLVQRLDAEGLRVDDVMATQQREPSPTADYAVIERAASTLLPPLLEAESARRRLRECEVSLTGLAERAMRVDPMGHDAGCVGRIHAAVGAHSPEAYAAALEYARRLHRLRPSMTERDARIERLAAAAPVWAERVAQRTAPHDSTTVPGDVTMAWIWRQLNDTLVERDTLDAHEFQRQIDRAQRRLRDVTEALIEARAWGRQLERLQSDQSMQQALVGWLDTTKRLLSTRQPERRQTLLTEARKLMKKCADAVPVWIMPIPIVAESFDPATARFDVVIIDEASQADLNALIPLYLGSQIVIVGDNEQVTPLGVGKSQGQLETLRRTMLEGIPNSHLFDSQFSIYDVARQSFGDAVRLVEHFRCVPEIIAFSNQLSYGGAIRPLRESTSTDIKPACVPCRVHGVREGDTNQAEARRIVDTIQSMIRHPRYAGKTIGIISMVGEAQAILIQSMIHKQIPGLEIEKRRIRAGISGEFQGDERDVIFLSMVDSPTEGGPLRTVGDGAFEQTKKRFNVAASRARDQMWVMHSFDPDLHLRAADLRLGLLRHMRDPEATLKAVHQESRKSESPFERDVVKRLTDAGYMVRPQWQVGYYRIDLVVEGGGRRLAVECDGDRYQPIENLADDMERQSILERLGWEFVRLRGSAFFRDPDAAMRPVFERLRELDIPAVGDREQFTRSDVSLLQELDALVPRGIDADEPVFEVG